MKCKTCSGTIVNLGDNYGCLSCGRPLKSVKVKLIKENNKLVEIVKTSESISTIEHKGVLHLGPIDGEKIRRDYGLENSDEL